MRRLSVLGVLAFALLSGCSGAASGSRAVLLGDGYIRVPAAPYTAGLATIEIENVGELDHTLVVTKADGSPIAATGSVPAGEFATLTVDLAPGTYTFSCRIVVQLPDGTVMDHYQLGMVSTITVEGAPSGADEQPPTSLVDVPLQPATTQGIAEEDQRAPSGGYGAGNE